MHRAVVFLTGMLAVTSCGGSVVLDSAPLRTPPAETSLTPTTEPVAAPAWQPIVDTRARYEGFGSLTPEANSLVALAQGDIDVFESPDVNEARLTVPWQTILGTVTVLTVVDRPSSEWIEVMLPIRPNGSTGFIQSDDVEIYAIGGKIIVDLSDRELTYTLGDTEIMTTTVAVGTSSNPTPTGTFFVTDNVTLANPNSPWGPHALGLSARSETITEYNGGDGIIGIHGTSNPSSIGQAASLGCVRLPNELITLLHGMVPIGTPVEIRA